VAASMLKRHQHERAYPGVPIPAPCSRVLPAPIERRVAINDARVHAQANDA
jgi:hypothetical protein